MKTNWQPLPGITAGIAEARFRLVRTKIVDVSPAASRQSTSRLGTLSITSSDAQPIRFRIEQTTLSHGQGPERDFFLGSMGITICAHPGPFLDLTKTVSAPMSRINPELVLRIAAGDLVFNKFPLNQGTRFDQSGFALSLSTGRAIYRRRQTDPGSPLPLSYLTDEGSFVVGHPLASYQGGLTSEMADVLGSVIDIPGRPFTTELDALHLLERGTLLFETNNGVDVHELREQLDYVHAYLLQAIMANVV